MSGCIVHVFGVPKFSSKNDLEIYFQSKKKSGGGELEDIEFDPELGQARIVFKESSAAKRVLAKTSHKHKGASLTVTDEMTSMYDGRIHSEGLSEEELEDTECASVVVSGLSPKTTKDAIQMYFENVRRSHGGEVKSVELNSGHAVVTFESPKVAKTVLEWGKHTLDDCPLTVTKLMPPKKSPPNEDEDIEQPVQRSRIVRVMDISDKTTKDALLNFFENTRRSGGGEIEDIQHIPEERLADITFCFPDDAERVSEKKVLELDGSKLTLTLKEIPKEIPKNPYKLHVVGISEKTTKDGLVSFMEVVSQEEVDSILFGSNSNAMITFKVPPDIERVHKKCSTRALDGSHLKIEKVNICDCIEVTGLAPNTTKDTVFYYFDNPRNGGGVVKNVELDSDDTRALVFFEDPSVVDLVIKGKHKINGAKLQVVPFYPFLGDSSADPGGGKKERVMKVNPQAVEFINKFALQEFDQLLEERRVKYTWHQDSKEIILACPEPKMDKRAWENSCEAVVVYFNQIVSEKITVSREAWGDMCKRAKEKCSSSKDVVAITCKEKECSFTLTGKQRDVSVLSEQLNDLKTEIEKQLAFEKNKISKSIDLTEAQLQLLSLSGFVEDLQARYKDLEVELSKKDGTINFKGPDVVVKEGNITVWQTLSRIKELDLELPKPIVAVVGSQPGKVYIATKLKKENIDAVVNCDPISDNQLLVTAVDRKDAKKAADLVKDLTSEQSIHLDDDQKRLMKSEKWNQLKRSIQQSMLLEVIEDLAASTLWIAGIKEEVDHAKEKVDEFCEENIILDQVINAESGRLKFIFRCQKDTIQSLEKSLANQSVKITKETDESSKVSALVVNGTRDGIQQAVPKVQKLLKEIKERKVDLDKPGMKKLFSQKKGMNLLSIVENDHECVIERCTPADSRQSFSRSESTHGNKSSSKLICSFVTPEEKTILLYKGDLTEQPVDVMVNAANGKLDHIGGLAKGIVVKGGREIQDECNEHVLRNGSLLDGEVYVSKPGKLPCKRIVHAVGPDWRSNWGYNRPKAQDKEKKVRLLGQTVYSSLEAAEKFSSIAVPAISAGVFGCPAHVCAKTLIESVLEYSEENSSCKLSEIRFVDMDDSVIKAFHDEMKQRFGKEHSFSEGSKPKTEAKSVHSGKVTGRGRRRGRSKGKELADEPVRDETVRDEPAESAAVYDDPNALTTALGMKILVIIGDLAKEEINGQALWEWRKILNQKQMLFESLQCNLPQIGYRLTSNSSVRMGNNLNYHVNNMVKKALKFSNSVRRRSFCSGFWATIGIHRDEVAACPKDTAKELEEKREENRSLHLQLDKTASELCRAMTDLRRAERHGKPFREVGERQQQRIKKEIRNKAAVALQFADLYGLTPKFLEFEDTASGAALDVKLPNDNGGTSLDDSLDNDDKQKVQTILYIMDRFSISLEGYHELTQVHSTLPRTHAIEQCAKELNNQWKITRTPGRCHGAELPFKDLLEKQIKKHLESGGAQKKIRVKLSGDGAKMSHASNLFVFSFALLDMEGQNILSSAANHTVALVMGSEDHNNLKESLANVIKDVNSLIDIGRIQVQEKELELEFFLGGDYKFLLNAMGMKAATSDNSCIWCKLHKKHRCDMSHTCSYFQGELARKLGSHWHTEPGCQYQPLFNIPLDHVLIDELHLMLRVMDRLEEGLIKDVIFWDKEEEKNNTSCYKKGQHLKDLLDSIHSLGVSFEVWHNKAKELEWTPLLGNEKRCLLQKLPNLFDKFLPEAKVDKTRSLWVNFCHLLNQVNIVHDQESAECFERKALAWGKQMVAMSGSGPGYMHTVIITPYMHILVYHVPEMLKAYSTLKCFSGQGVEKKNDDYRRYFHRKINRWDATYQLLLIEKRQETLKHLERQKRKYTKVDKPYWYEGGKAEVAKKVPRISTAVNIVEPSLPTREELNKKKVPELLELLQSHGIQMNGKKRKQELIQALLERQQ